MNNLKSFSEYLLEKENKEKKIVEPIKGVEIEEPDEITEVIEKPKGLTAKQKKNLPKPLQDAILKAQK